MNKKELEPVLTYPSDYFTNYDKYNDLIENNNKFCTNSNKIKKMNDMNDLNKKLFIINTQQYPEKYLEFLMDKINYQKLIINEMLININQTNEFIFNLKNK